MAVAKWCSKSGRVKTIMGRQQLTIGWELQQQYQKYCERGVVFLVELKEKLTEMESGRP